MTVLRRLPLVLVLTAAGCMLTSGQFRVDFVVGDLIVTNFAIEATQIDLNGISTYDDHKEQVKGLADVAFLGKATNFGSSDIEVEAWMTPGVSNYTTDLEVRANAIKIWGPYALPGGATTTLNWDHSAAVVTTAGRAALLNEITGDGKFTVYLIGTSGTYNFAVDNGVAVFVIDAGV